MTRIQQFYTTEYEAIRKLRTYEPKSVGGKAAVTGLKNLDPRGKQQRTKTEKTEAEPTETQADYFG